MEVESAIRDPINQVKEPITPPEQEELLEIAEQEEPTTPPEQEELLEVVEQEESTTPLEQEESTTPLEQEELIEITEQKEPTTPLVQEELIEITEQKEPTTPPEQEKPTIPLVQEESLETKKSTIQDEPLFQVVEDERVAVKIEEMQKEQSSSSRISLKRNTRVKRDKPFLERKVNSPPRLKISSTTSKKRVGKNDSVKKTIKILKGKKSQSKSKAVKIVKQRKENQIQEINDKDVYFCESSLRKLAERGLYTGETQVESGVVELTKFIILDHLDDVLQKAVKFSEKRPNSNVIRVEDVEAALHVESEKAPLQEKEKKKRKSKSSESNGKKKHAPEKRKHATTKN